MNVQSHLDTLNPAQRVAASHTEGPILILAGAGAGKTKTLVHRIINLIEQGVPGGKILAITFTNKAAKEMRERVTAALATQVSWSDTPLVCTFHSLGVRIIKENAAALGLTKHFSILDESDSVALVREAIKDSNLDPKQYEPKRIRHLISRFKNDFMTARDAADRAASLPERITADIWSKYESYCKRENALDFDDLLLKSVLLLEREKAILEQYQERWKYIHVDEYQDTNEVQYRLAKLLAQKYNNICVVGDGDQNIYGWRGANIKNILNFEKDYPNSTTVLLEQNYRSTSTILEVANEVIKKNTMRKDKNLFTEKEGGDKVTLVECYDENTEADFVASKITELMDAGVHPNDMAILYRANFQSRAFEEALLMHSLPYQVLGVRFFDRKEVKDTLSYIRAALNPDSLSDIKRIINFPARGIGKVTIAKLFAGQLASLPPAMQKKIETFYAILQSIRGQSETMSPSELIKYLIKKTGIEDSLKFEGDEGLERLENIQELVTLAARYDVFPDGTGLEKLLEEGALASDQDTLDQKDKKDGVRLMTVHASKGLEFKTVFIVGLEQDLFPHRRGEGKRIEDQEEERRLFYVALTRAKEKLFLTYASIRTLFGMRQVNAPSEFLYDLPEHLVERETSVGDKIIYFT